MISWEAFRKIATGKIEKKNYKGAIYIMERQKCPLRCTGRQNIYPVLKKKKLSCGGCWLHLTKCIGHELSTWSVSRHKLKIIKYLQSRMRQLFKYKIKMRNSNSKIDENLVLQQGSNLWITVVPTTKTSE